MSRSMFAIAFVAAAVRAQDVGRSLTVEVVTHDGRPAPWARVFVAEAGSRWLLWTTLPEGVDALDLGPEGRRTFSAHEVLHWGARPDEGWRAREEDRRRWRLFAPVMGGVGPSAVVDPHDLREPSVRLVLPPAARLEVPIAEIRDAAYRRGDRGGSPVVVCGPPDRVPAVKRAPPWSIVCWAGSPAECVVEEALGLRCAWREAAVFGPLEPRAFFVVAVSDRRLQHGPESATAFRAGAAGDVDKVRIAPLPVLCDVRLAIAESRPTDWARIHIEESIPAAEAVPLERRDFPVEERSDDAFRRTDGVLARLFRVPVRRTSGPTKLSLRLRPPAAEPFAANDDAGSFWCEIEARPDEDGVFDLGIVRPVFAPRAGAASPDVERVAAYRATLPRRGFSRWWSEGYEGPPRDPEEAPRCVSVEAADGLPTDLATLWCRTPSGVWTAHDGFGGGLYPLASEFDECWVTAPGHAGRRVTEIEIGQAVRYAPRLGEFPKFDGVVRLAPRRVAMAAVRLVGDDLPTPPRALAVRLVYAGPPDAATARPDPDHPFSRQVGGGMRFGTERRAWWFVREPGRYVVRMFVVDPVLGRYDVPPMEAPEDVGEVVVRDEDATYSVDVALTENLRRAVRR